MTVTLPRVYNKNLAFKSILHPIRVSLTQNITPLSYASIEARKGESLNSREFVEIFTPYGSAGFYRVTSPGETYGSATTTSQLEHAIAEVGDYVVKEEISTMMAATTAMSKVFGHYNGKRWKLGTVSALGSGQVAVEANHDSVLDAMLAILEQKPDCMMDFNFSTSPWTVNIVKKGTTVEAEGRLSRNLISARISMDDSDLCTRAYYKTFSTNKKGETEEKWTSRDADTIGNYGVVEREVSTSSDMTTNEINYAVNTYLNEHKQPKYSVEISAEELSHITSESMDKFRLGKLMRLVIPDYNVIVEKHINSIAWGDLFNAPEQMTVCMGDEEDTVVSFLHEVESVTTSSGKSNTSVKRWKEYETKIDQTDKYIDMYARRVDKAGNILEQAGMDINSKGVLIYATDNVNMVGSKIQTEADRISLVVEGTGKNAKIKPASIVASINNSKSTIKIDADHIKIGSGSSAISLNGAFTIVNGHLTAKKNLYMDWENTKSKIYTSGGVEFVGATSSQGVRSYNLNYTVIGEMIKTASVTSGTLKLEKFSGEIINFKKVTSLSSVWSDGTITVSGVPAGSVTPLVETLVQKAATWAGDKKSATIPIYSQWGSQGQYEADTGRTISVDATPAFNEGKKNAEVTLSYGTVTTDSAYQKHVTFKATNDSNTNKKDEMILYLTRSSGKAQLRKGTASGTVIMEISTS